MTTITASVVVAVAPLIGVYLVFLAVAHGVRDEQDSEVEVKLFPPTIRRKVKRADRRVLKADTATGERGVSASGGPPSLWRHARRLFEYVSRLKGTVKREL
jgi:hypothetical protein